MIEHREFVVRGEVRAIAATVLRDMPGRPAPTRPADPFYTVNAWCQDGSGGGEQQIATANHRNVALAAYEAAVKAKLLASISLRNGIWRVRSTEQNRERRKHGER